MSEMLEKEISTDHELDTAGPAGTLGMENSELQNDFLVMQKACSEFFHGMIKGCGRKCNLNPNRRECAAFKATMLLTGEALIYK